MNHDLGARRIKELLAAVLIGDGIITLLRPRQHSLLWWAPLPGVRQLMTWCAEHPNASRLIGAAQIAFALWLDARQYRDGRYDARLARHD